MTGASGAVIIFAALVLSGTSSPLPEEPLQPVFRAEADDSALDVAAQLAKSAEEQQRRREASRGDVERARGASVQAARVTTLVVACPGNGPQPDRTNLILCDVALNGCAATPAPNDILYWVWPGTRRADGTVEQALGPSGEVCEGPDQAGQEAVVAVPELTLADFRRLPLPAGDPTIQPGNGYTLVNVPTNVFVDAEPVLLDTTLIGFPVQVRATPSRYSWEFGDGASLGPTEDPGGPYPDLSTTHTYEDAGRYAVSLTTFYTGEYSVGGGPWLPVDGEAQVPSEPVGVEALAGRNVLVDGTLDH